MERERGSLMDFDKETLQAAQAAFGFAAGLISQEPTEDWVRSCIDDDMFAAAPFTHWISGKMFK